MPFGKYETPKPTPTPTFLQYLRTIGKGVEGKTKFQVDIVWTPSKFNNVTLQTHAFRYQCDENHPLFSEMQVYISDEFTKGVSPRLNIVIVSIENREIEIIEDFKVKGQWEKMGGNAYKYKNP